jgi:hypothetical protein
MNKRALPVALALATALASAPGGAARADTSPPGLPPGATLDETTWKQAEGLFPEEILARYRDGKFRSPVGKIVAPYQLDESFLAASEANAGKFRISPEGSLVEAATGKPPEYSFGLPFPKIDPNDPQAAEKILWNYEYAYWSNGSNKITSRLVWLNGTGKSPERSVVLQSLAMVYEGNRRKIENPQQFSRLDRNLLLEPADANGTASLGWRYKDPAKRDQLWAYVPALRRVRATSPSNRSDGVFGSEMTQDDGFNGFDAKPEDFTYKLVGQKDQYMSFAPEALEGKVPFSQYPDGQGWGVTSPEFVYGYKLPDPKLVGWAPVQSVLVARPVWLLEATPKDRYYLYGKILIAIDRETYKVSNVVKFDWKGQPVGVFNRGISYGKAPDGYRFVNLTGGGQGGAYAENTKLERATAAEVMPKPVDNAIDIKLAFDDFQPDRLVQLGR